MSDLSSSAPPPTFMLLPDLASRSLGGSVVAANDELFAQRENLIKPEPSVFSPHEFGHKGKVYDGWETRRRRDVDPGGTTIDQTVHDWAIVRLGVPGVVHGVVVDTAWFTGNYPPFVSVEAQRIDGYPPVEDLLASEWTTIAAKAPAAGDTANTYAIEDRNVWTHLKLSIYPDGGVARFRVHGRPTPDPRFLVGTVDLAALENGGRMVVCSDAFYSSPANLILPGRARVMSEGWENARRRSGGNDWAVFALAGEGVIEHVEVDTSYFVGNAAGAVRLRAGRVDGADGEDGTDRGDGAVEWTDESAVGWWDVVPRQAVLADTRHRFLVDDDGRRPATHVRLDVYPDGGLSRLRVHGHLTEPGLDAVRRAAGGPR